MRGCRPLTVFEAEALLKSFRGRWAARNRALWVLGCSTGFRIEELLSLRIGDVATGAGRIVSEIAVPGSRMKESRGRSWKVSKRLRRELAEYLNWLCATGRGRKPERRLFETDCRRSLEAKSAWESIRRAKIAAGLEGRVGTHSMRKTFAWRVYEEALRQLRDGSSELDPMRAVQLALGHKSLETTISYMAFLDKDLDKIKAALLATAAL